MMTNEILDGIYQIDVPLPNNPLRNLNSYFIRGRERDLLIDTGFRLDACREALLDGLGALGADMRRTDIFLTHLHSDHTGLAPEIASPQTRVFISKPDYEMLGGGGDMTLRWKKYDALFLGEGFSQKELDELTQTNPARLCAPRDVSGFLLAGEGEVFCVGKYEFACVATPGHTPGHLCLYDKTEKLMFLGDHVLFDITPNINVWPGFSNPLGAYLKSLDKMRGYDVALPLPAHRTAGRDLRGRIDELIAHHGARLEETLSIVAADGGLNAYEIAGKMSWKIKSRSWADFPLPQKWFAVGEALAHLEYLTNEGKVTREEKGGVHLYRALGDEPARG